MIQNGVITFSGFQSDIEDVYGKHGASDQGEYQTPVYRVDYL